MANLYEIRADFDRDTIIVYQAYNEQIATSALKQQRFVTPFSFTRMTWIKPSFLWLMERSNWGRKAGQEHILALRISQAGWLKALNLGVLTSPERRVYQSGAEWSEKFAKAKVQLQWDTERDLRGNALPYYSIQVGISSVLIEEFVSDWIVEIRDYTPLTRKVFDFCKKGDFQKAKRLLPLERIYPLAAEIKRTIGAS